ncbi:MAG: response regulator [Alphaproteobacteria bacterium]|nr:response regulator [Alphaproteobacteria bacterium]
MSSALDDMSKLKVLIAEDQNEVRSMLRNMLMELGINQIFESGDGREALNFIDSAFDFVDLIICDWNMPNMNGVELLRQIRTVDPDIPFLMITGRSDIESVVEAKSSGVSAYISKPFSPVQLEAKLRILLARMAKAS